MKKFLTSMMALTIAMSAFAFDQAQQDSIYYGSKCAAIGLADGTVGVYCNYLDSGLAAWVPPTIEIWENDAKVAEYEVSQVGYYDTEWNKGWGFEVKCGEEDVTAQVTSLTIYPGIKRIEESAFGWKLTAVEEVIIPSTVTEIGAYAFTNCDSLKHIYCVAASAPALLPVTQDPTWGADHFKGGTEWDAIVKNCQVVVPSEDAKATYDQQGGDNGLAWTYWGAFYANNNVVVDTELKDPELPEPQAVDNTEVTAKAHKIVRNGQVLIERNGTFYDLTGAIVK